MSNWWLAFAALFCLAAAVVLVPVLVRPVRHGASRAESAAAVLQDKLAQIARDHENGLIGADEAEGARAEISRALIAATKEVEAARAADLSRNGGAAGMALVAVVGLFVAVAVYQIKGSFGLADKPHEQRTDLAVAASDQMPALTSEHEGTAMGDAIASLRARLEQNPDSIDSWHLLARSYSAVGAYADAAVAYARLVELAPDTIAYRGDHAEALIRADGGYVGDRAIAIFESVLEIAPDDPRAAYYLALRHAQDGDLQAAAEAWVRILAKAPPDAPYAPAIREILDTVIADGGLDREALDIPPVPEAPAAPGPSAADIAAAAEMPQGEQLEMIRGMVARLESRLEDEPADIEGWLRLARARMVLGEPEAGAAALERALERNPGDPNLQAALAEIRSAASR
ncbi:MAG TPA: c-type cytochrome biogenesis protein CcmI [Thermohalobaculum sp.]|nr:c-type cytochrome biogenesis protein CcmI [Thermohalobaculum sp.]